MRRKKVHWLGWLRYYLGRSLEVLGLLLVTSAMFLYFGTAEMRPMLALTGVGMFVYFIGWLLARKNPQAGFGKEFS